MTPKEKAQEIYSHSKKRFDNVHVEISGQRHSIVDADLRAKELCLILCDEVISSLGDADIKDRNGTELNIWATFFHKEYWLKVKAEIEKL